MAEIDQFLHLCSEAVYDKVWLDEFKTDRTGNGYVVLLTGVKPKRSALVTWSESLGFKIEIRMPDSHYYEAVDTAMDAYSRALLLACD